MNQSRIFQVLKNEINQDFPHNELTIIFTLTKNFQLKHRRFKPIFLTYSVLDSIPSKASKTENSHFQAKFLANRIPEFLHFPKPESCLIPLWYSIDEQL